MLSIRPAVDADRPQVIRLCAQTFGDARAARMDREWDWHWRDDPRLSSPGVRGMAALWCDQLLGFTAFLPAGLHVAGQPVEACWGGMAMLDFSLLRRATREARGAGRAEVLRDGEARGLLRQLTKPARMTGIVMSKHVAPRTFTESKKDGYLAPSSAGGWQRDLSATPKMRRGAGRIIGGIVGAAINLVKGRKPRPVAGVDVHQGAFDGRFDALWESARASYPAITRRDADVLNWRYRMRPGVNYTMLTLSDGAGLRGYCVVRTAQVGKAVHGMIIDLLARLGDDGSRSDLVGASLYELKRMGAEKAYCYAAGDLLTRALARCGFRPRRTPDPLILSRWPAKDVYFTEGDGEEV